MAITKRYMGISTYLLLNLAIIAANRNFPNNIEIDISWDFEGSDYEGWASATPEEMQVC